ncbi:MAG: LysE family translocator [Rhodoferax sp.]
MNLSTWWLFVLMTFVVSATPGPNMLYVMSVSARSGVRSAIRAMAGCMTALLAMMSLSAAGLGALLQSFPAVFDTLRLAGAAYLAYLGVKCWRAPVENTPPASAQTATITEASARSAHSVFRQAFLVAASNPKAILFAAAFFPQFINPDQGQWTQFAILLSTFSAIEIGWYFVYAISGKRLSVYLQEARILRLFNRVTGGVFVGFAALMASAREA